jgi:hypothetical protein
VKSPELAKIGPAYDWASIFRDAQQAKGYINPYAPYAEGGSVEDLMKIVRKK